jgi:hypothetical protein
MSVKCSGFKMYVMIYISMTSLWFPVILHTMSEYNLVSSQQNSRQPLSVFEYLFLLHPVIAASAT